MNLEERMPPRLYLPIVALSLVFACVACGERASDSTLAGDALVVGDGGASDGGSSDAVQHDGGLNCTRAADCPTTLDPCRSVSCGGDGVCTFTLDAVGTACEDGDACTVADRCAQDGTCAAGKVRSCQDDSPCTTDSCDSTIGCVHAPTTGSCEDGNACTQGDTCTQGVCLPGAVTSCDDNNPCTEDSCDTKSGCGHDPNTAACSDKDVCTQGDQCVAGGCKPGAIMVCDDGNPCTTDTCDTVVGCTLKGSAKGTACSDQNVCTLDDTCDGDGVCLPGQNTACDDNNACTADSCSPVQGCASAPHGKPCNDGNVCTVGDVCVGGGCKAGEAFDCADGNPCTDDSCDDAAGCAHKANSKPCDDNNNCTKDEACSGGACMATTPSDCDDGDVCTTESCDPSKGCQSAYNTAPCSDGSVCTLSDTCGQGVCKPGALQGCGDGNPCTTDSCDKLKGCLNLPNQATCSDDNACTKDDVCAAGACAAKLAYSCDDGDVCSVDSCDPKKGCQHAAVSMPCSDGDACTLNDVCKSGACVSGAIQTCDDGNPCTDDSCLKVKGCGSQPNSAKCNDGNPCTTNDVCVGGQCKGSGALNCDDNNGCTADSCNGVKGCVHVAALGACSDGDVCTVGDACLGGSCKSGKAKNCDDGSPCTVDSCDAKSGCKTVLIKNGALCGFTGVCAQGACNCPTEDWYAGENLGCTDCACAPDGTKGSGAGISTPKSYTFTNVSEGDWFSLGLAASGTTVVVGAPTDDFQTSDEGAVYVLNRDAKGGLKLHQRIRGPGMGSGAKFGEGLAFDGELLIAGAPGHDATRGAAVVMRRKPDGTWHHAATLSRKAASVGDEQGQRLSLSGDILAVSAHGADNKGVNAGAVVIFERNEQGAWLESGAIYSPKPRKNGNFGLNLALGGTTLVVGDKAADLQGEDAGVAYLFSQQTGAWKLHSTLTRKGAAAQDLCGAGLAVQGARVLVGCQRRAVGQVVGAGSVVVWDRATNGAWAQTAELFDPIPQLNGAYGATVAIDGKTVLVTSYDSSVKKSGAGRVVMHEDRGAQGWKTIGAIDGTEKDGHLGRTLAISGGWAYAGEPQAIKAAGRVVVFGATRFECNALGACPCKAGFGGEKCDKVVAPCDVLNACDDESACTIDSCDKASGKCSHKAVPNGAACSDGNACLAGDSCSFGTCVASAVHLCPGGNSCTTALCDAAYGCSYVKRPEGTVCGGTGACVSGGCACALEQYFGGGACKACGCDEKGAKLTDNKARIDAQIQPASAAYSDQWGAAMDTDGKRLILGSRNDDDKGYSSGTASIWVRDADGGWKEEALIMGTSTTYGDQFGAAVAISGDYAAVGAPFDDNKGTNSGALFVFEREAKKWTQKAELLGVHTGSYDQLGTAVTMGGDTVVVGSPFEDWKGSYAGAAFVFKRNTTGVWTETQLLAPAGVSSSDQFGFAMDLVGDRLVISAPFDGIKGVDSGTLYVFERPAGGDFVVKTTLVVPSVLTGRGLGERVVMRGDWILAGAPGEPTKGAKAGGAHLFQRSATGGWAFSASLYDGKAAADDRFGSAVVLTADGAVVGAPNADNGVDVDAGALLFFAPDSKGVWQLTQRLSGPVNGAHLGVEITAANKDVMAGLQAWGGKGAAFSLRFGSRDCDAQGQCQCLSGYGGSTCATVINPCLIPAYCDDGNACTKDACDTTAKKCVHTKHSDGTVCDDGDACSDGDACKSGTCVAGKKIVCD